MTIEVFLPVANEIWDSFFIVRSLITRSGCGIPAVVIDKAQLISKGYKDKTRNVSCKNKNVRFSALFYWSSSKLQNPKFLLD